MRKNWITSPNMFHHAVVNLLLAGATMSFAGAARSADSGDAPASFGQALHEIVPGAPYLGDVEPDEDSLTTDVNAAGDDENGVDDEGGVFAFPVLVQNTKSYDTNVFASNPSDNNATLAGWIDFDGNGFFDTDEYATATVVAGTVNGKYKLNWPDLTGISSSFAGTTYARFRISTSLLSADASTGVVADGEVEDYALQILLDSDGDERPDISDPDNDNDGIPDTVEGLDRDTDNDGTPDYLDVDSDADFVPDYIEAGSNPLFPVDSDSDGIPDYLDGDSNNDGVPDSQPSAGDADNDTLNDAVEGSVDTDGDGILDRDDIDSDNDTIPDVIEAGILMGIPADTDGDGIADYLDGDSDNDGIPDIREANSGELNVNKLDLNNDGRVDAGLLTGANGLVNTAETVADSGVPLFAVADSDADGIRDFRDIDSDNDGVSDLLEGGGLDTDGNGLVDSFNDLNQDGIVDNANLALLGILPDTDADGIPDFQDDDADGSSASPDNGTPTNPGQSLETGLSGGVGCSVGTPQQSSDTLFWVFLSLLSLFALHRRRIFPR